MPEQLNLQLEPAMPRPGDVLPMWPTPRPDPFDSSEWLFEPTWGGHRAIAFVEPGAGADAVAGSGSVRVVDPNGTDLAERLPELAGLAVRVAARSAVLDGELVVVDVHGRADDDALRERLAGRPGRPVAYLVFDLLHLDGKWLLGQPLDKRRTILRRVLRPGDEVVVVPAITGEGLALHAAVSAQGIAGILARRRASPYLPGVHSTLWRAIPAGAPGEAGLAGVPGEAGLADLAAAAAAPGGAPGAASPAQGTAPVLALFRRLPFLEEPEA